jgi:hypothetical protein
MVDGWIVSISMFIVCGGVVFLIVRIVNGSVLSLVEK